LDDGFIARIFFVALFLRKEEEEEELEKKNGELIN